MGIFQLKVASNRNGSVSAAWFDDDACLWNDERLSTVGSLATNWQAPLLKLYGPGAVPTAVLFNPNALAVSEGVRAELSSFTELEFLPLQIEKHGVFYILHVTSAIELPVGSQARCAPAPSGNIVRIDAFPGCFKPEFSFFRVLQPVGSAARKVAASTRAIYLSSNGARAIESSAGGYLVASEMSDA